jgi:uncharacterized protein YndB with AHSA1/START domain
VSDERRSIELEIEVPGTPEEVWQAIATGPGISSWYVPHTVEERAGGAATASFGPGPDLQVPGRVAAWEPPHRVVFDSGEGSDGLAFEWLVEARQGGTCVVRLINSGFTVGSEWDDQFDAMSEGWLLFLFNLKLHREHFAGRWATAMLPMATWAGPRLKAWERLTSELGIREQPNLGDRLEVTADGAARLAGSVIDIGEHRIALLLDSPAPGTAIITAEGAGDQVMVSVWAYLYGNGAGAAVERDDPIWLAWLGDRA